MMGDVDIAFILKIRLRNGIVHTLANACHRYGAAQITYIA